MIHTYPRTSLVVLALASWLCAASAVTAQISQDPSRGGSAWIDVEAAPRPEMRAVRRSGEIVHDGLLDESAWADAPPATRFVQSFPDEGMPATQDTEVRILFDAERLYIGARMHETEPDGIISRGLRRDFASIQDDVFGVALDTFLDRRNAFYFFINPNGAIRDSQAFDNSRISGTEWDGVIDVRAARFDGGWSVEIVVPFSTLRFDPTRPEQTWGIQFLRRVRRNNEDAHWAPITRRDQIHRMDRAGTLVGLVGIAPSRNLAIEPYFKASDTAGSAAAEVSGERSWDGGVDLKYGVTPRLTLDATWRTDFSQVEVDQQQVNLTRFSLFFPEKRGFFVENSGTFAFGDVTERNVRMGASPRDLSLFHSRRIGLEDGRPVAIRGGARLTGRAAGMEIGVLSMLSEATADAPAEQFSVARVRKDLVGAVDVGGIFLNRQASGGGYDRSYGWDANARLFGGLIANSYVARTDRPDASGDPWAGRVSVSWRDALWDHSVLFRHVGDGFEPGIGYVRRTGVRQHYVTLGAHPRMSALSVSEANPYLEVNYVTDLGGSLETRELIAALAVEFLDSGTLDLAYTDRFERLDEGFDVLDATVPAGRYRFGETSLSYAANASRTLSANLALTDGGYYSGSRRSVSGGAVWRPGSRWGIEVSGQWNVIDVGGVRARAGLLGSRVSYDHSTTLFASAFVQYNDVSGEVVSNLRLNWVHAPLSDVFLVYTERRSTRSGGVLDRRATLKVTKLLAL